MSKTQGSLSSSLSLSLLPRSKPRKGAISASTWYLYLVSASNKPVYRGEAR